MNLRERLAWNLRAIRTGKKVTQENLAVDAAVDRTTISGLENGDFNPSLDIIERLAAALGVEAVELFSAPPNDASALAGLRPGRKPSRRNLGR